jgi:hypothetical protein
MQKKLVRIGVLDKGVVLEGLSKEGKKFDDIVTCCQYILSQDFEKKKFIELKKPDNYKRKIDLYGVSNTKSDKKKYWWELLDFADFSIGTTEDLDINSLEEVLVTILRNEIRDEELSEKVRRALHRYMAERLSEKEIASCLTKLLNDSELS